MVHVRKHWLPVVVWMIAIFAMSTDFGSEAHTSRIIGPFLRWLYPSVSVETIHHAQFLVRKGAHVTVYLVLALLALHALRTALNVAAAKWSWRAAGFALLISTAYAATDEFHQSFVPSRGASPHDVLIDACGALVGLFLAFLWQRRGERGSSELTSEESRASQPST